MTAWTLCSEQDVRDLQTMPATIPETWSEMVEGMIREHTGLTMLGLTEDTFTQYISGDNSNIIRVKKSPIVSVTSLTIDGVSVDSANMYIGSYSIQLLNGLVFTYGTRNVIVTYTAGSGSITTDIRMAAAQMIVAVNNYYGRGGSDASMKWSTMTDGERGGEDSATKNLGLAGHLESIMKATIKNKRMKIA